MFRQFLVDASDCDTQRILWFDSNEEIVSFRLKTVTYGTACDPFLANASLLHLADSERELWRVGTNVILDVLRFRQSLRRRFLSRSRHRGSSDYFMSRIIGAAKVRRPFGYQVDL